MEKKWTRDNEAQRGEIMLEAAIVFVPVLVMLMSLLSLGFWFYQMAMMTNVASEIATEVARNIKFDNLGSHGDRIEMGDIAAEKMFRMTFNMNKLKNTQEERAQAYADWRIPLSTLGFGAQNPMVELELKSSGLGRAHVKVKVSQNTNFFLSGVLKYAGIVEDNPVFGGTAYAECVDPMGYTAMVNFLRYGSQKLDVFSSVGKLYTKVKDLMSTLNLTF